MCGLAGLIGNSQEKRQKFLIRAGASLRNRGPDGEGLWNPPGKIGLVHRRLSIVDLSEAGAQPMVSADGRCPCWHPAFWRYRFYLSSGQHGPAVLVADTNLHDKE